MAASVSLAERVVSLLELLDRDLDTDRNIDLDLERDFFFGFASVAASA